MSEPKEGIEISESRVWIDQDLCTGDGLCAEIAPDVFYGRMDGLYGVKEIEKNFTEEILFDGKDNPEGAEGLARFPKDQTEIIEEAAEECPGECIFIKPPPSASGGTIADYRTADILTRGNDPVIGASPNPIARRKPLIR